LPPECQEAPAAVLVEFDAGGFESAPNNIQCRATRLANPGLKLMGIWSERTAQAFAIRRAAD